MNLMKMIGKMIVLSGMVLMPFSPRVEGAPLKIAGFSLTELGENKYDAASTPEGAKTSAQVVVDKLNSLGTRHINLSPRATMSDPRGTEVKPMTAIADRSSERARYLRLIKYIQSQGMSVGIRPLFFVVDQSGNTPSVEVLPDGTKKIWWHGNIQPRDPNRWFDSFRNYLEPYLLIAKLGKVQEFTIGAELYSMTVGIEDQWMDFPHGFPGQWVKILEYVRNKLGPNVRIMYDINFTDDKVSSPSFEEYGGEFARWKYRLVTLANPQNQYWQDVATFWKGLDAIGIDLYRSLATATTPLPLEQEALIRTLQTVSDEYATQLDTSLAEIAAAVGKSNPIILKEIGFKSVEKSFINPFEYTALNRPLNVAHQAAAYEAMLRSFWKPGWDWLQGVYFWDASADLAQHGTADKGFSPLGKAATENVLRDHFGRN